MERTYSSATDSEGSERLGMSESELEMSDREGDLEMMGTGSGRGNESNLFSGEAYEDHGGMEIGDLDFGPNERIVEVENPVED